MRKPRQRQMSSPSDTRGPLWWQRFCRRSSPRRHLYLQIYWSFVVVLVAFSLVVAALIWSFTERKFSDSNEHLVVLMEQLLPASAPAPSVHETLQALAGVTGSAVALYAADGKLIAQVGDVRREALAEIPSSWRGPFNAGYFRDGRRLVIDWHASGRHPPPLGWLAAIALLAALGAYPIARRLTRRIEALQAQADALARGNLSARAATTGCDEIAELGRRFNQAASHIEGLVNGQRVMLASASHELRSPLARIRMATSLIGDERPDLQDQIVRDIAELDALIGDLLLASRLSTDTPALHCQTVDLLGLAAEEANRCGALLHGAAASIQGDARLLRHMLRNLLENSRRHAAGSAVEVELQHEANRIFLRVQDRGPGVPEAEREKIFEPFYRPPGTAETGEGVGYGLALVKRIAQLHGGAVRCLARCGGGACFEVELPEEVHPMGDSSKA